MEFAILFILAFLVGFAIYHFSRKWASAVLIPMIIFTGTTLIDVAARDAWVFTLLFGLPLVFFASLLGAYVVQIRDPDYIDSLDAERSQGDQSDKDG